MEKSGEPTNLENECLSVFGRSGGGKEISLKPLNNLLLRYPQAVIIRFDMRGTSE